MLALWPGALLASHPGSSIAPPPESGTGSTAQPAALESVPGFSASATTTAAAIVFDSAGYGMARVVLAIPRGEDRKPHREEVSRQVAPGRVSLIVPLPGEPRWPIEVSFEATYVTYELEETFGSFGRGEGQFLEPTHLAISPRGELYVVDTGADRIQVFDRALGFLFQFGSFNPSPFGAGAEVENARFDKPWDLVITGYQELFVTDQRNDRVVRFDLLGRVIRELGRDAELAIPRGIASDGQRDLYVCDTDNDRIVVFDRDGRFRKRIGAYGWGEKQFKYPTDVAVSADGTLFVADSGNRRVQVFDRFERLRHILEGPFEDPQNLYLDGDGFLFVLDAAGDRIYRYSNDLQLVETLPGPGAGYELDSPTDCARSPDGRLFIVDSGHSRLVVLRERARTFRQTGKLEQPRRRP